MSFTSHTQSAANTIYYSHDCQHSVSCEQLSMLGNPGKTIRYHGPWTRHRRLSLLKVKRRLQGFTHTNTHHNTLAQPLKSLSHPAGNTYYIYDLPLTLPMRHSIKPPLKHFKSACARCRYNLHIAQVFIWMEKLKQKSVKNHVKNHLSKQLIKLLNNNMDTRLTNNNAFTPIVECTIWVQ